MTVDWMWNSKLAKLSTMLSHDLREVNTITPFGLVVSIRDGSAPIIPDWIFLNSAAGSYMLLFPESISASFVCTTYLSSSSNAWMSPYLTWSTRTAHSLKPTLLNVFIPSAPSTT